MCLSVSCKKKSNADLALPTLPDAKSNISVWCSPIYSPPRQAGKDKQNKPGGTMQKSVVHCVSVYLCPGSNQSQFGTWFGSWKSFLTVILVHSCHRDAWKSTVYNVKTVSTDISGNIHRKCPIFFSWPLFTRLDDYQNNSSLSDHLIT